MNESVRVITVDVAKYKSSPPAGEHACDEVVIVADQDGSVDTSADEIVQSLRQSPHMNPNTSVYELIRNSEYLERYASWLSFCGLENKKRYPPTFIGRNDTIWELLMTERGYLDMLIMVRDLYLIPFPKFDAIDHPTGELTAEKLRSVLFPELDRLIDAHERIFRLLLALHDRNEDHTVQSLGACLLYLLDEPTQKDLSKLYGGFMFAQRRIRELLQVCKHIPTVALFFEKCRQDPRSGRRTLEDCHMVIVQHWTKVETLLDAIIKNTLNHPTEVKNLEDTKQAVRSLLKQAEGVMAVQEHTEKLSEFSRRFLTENPEDPDESYVRKIMLQPSTVLVNYGSLQVCVGSSLVDVMGVALNECFFVLQKSPDSDGYHLFRNSKMPPVLRWGQAYGYFRRAMSKGGFKFFIILQTESVLTQFQCSTVDELNRWEYTINEGFAKYTASAPCTLEDLDAQWQQTREILSERWRNTEVVFDLLRELDSDLERAWAARSCVSLVLIEERLKAARAEREEPPSPTESDLQNKSPDFMVSNQASSGDSRQHQTFFASADTPEGLEQIIGMFRELFVRLQFTLVGSTASLSRSASDVDERKRPSVKPLKKNETFSGRDIARPTYDLKSLSERKPKKVKREQTRLSSMANIFRTAARDKGDGPLPPSTLSTTKTGSRPPPAAFNISSTGSASRTSSSSTSVTPLTPNAGPRPSLSTGDHPLQSATTDFNTGSCTSLSSRQSVEALNLLKDLTELTEDFLPSVFDLRTQNDELCARVRYLEAEKGKLEDILSQAKQHGLIATGGINGADGISGASGAFSVKQETEKLRQDVENFRKRSEEWEKEYKRQRDALERDHAKLAKEWTRYEEDKAELERRQQQYVEARKTLQRQLDLYNQQGVGLAGTDNPEIKLPGDYINLAVPNKDLRRASSSSLADLSSLSFRSKQQTPTDVPIHAHSTSDDLSGQWAHPTGLFKDSRVRDTVSPSDHDDSTPRPNHATTPSMKNNDELPLHLRGSLVNQKNRQSEQPVTGKPPAAFPQFPIPNSRPPQPPSDGSNSSALFKLADSSKPSSNKPKKGHFFRRT